MRILLWALVALLVLAVVAPFILKDRHGRPLMGPEDVHLPKIKVPELPDLPSLPGSGDKAITVYKWQDAEGNWHYSDRAPEAAPEAEEVEVGTPTVTPEPPHAPEAAPETAPEGEKTGLMNGLPGVVQGARDARDRMSEHSTSLKEQLDGIDIP